MPQYACCFRNKTFILMPLLEAEKLVHSLTECDLSIATAESCTGGLIAAAITDVPGASRVFRYGWVTYCNEAKQRLLSVPPEIIEQHTVVSEPVVLAMAAGARKLAAADIAIAVSGNAGPTAAENEPPVGTVCMAVETSRNAQAVTLTLPNLTRAEFRREVVRRALKLALHSIAC